MTDWPKEHLELAKNQFQDGRSHAEIATCLNHKFKANYSRSAVCARLARAKLYRKKPSMPCKLNKIPLRFGIDISISGRA